MAGAICHSKTSDEKGFGKNLEKFQAIYRLSLQLLSLNSSRSHCLTNVPLLKVFCDVRVPVPQKDTYIRASLFDIEHK